MAESRKRRKTNRSSQNKVKTGSTRLFWCVNCEQKVNFVRRKVVDTSIFLGTSIDFNDGSYKIITSGQSYTGDECTSCKKFKR